MPLPCHALANYARGQFEAQRFQRYIISFHFFDSDDDSGRFAPPGLLVR